jgi:hypothetical protein
MSKPDLSLDFLHKTTMTAPLLFLLLPLQILESTAAHRPKGDCLVFVFHIPSLSSIFV